MNNGPSASSDLVSFLDTLRTMIEGLNPDLRKMQRPSVDGEVTKVYDDDANDETHYRVDVVVRKAGPEGKDLDLPRVPVDSIWAQNGWGFYCLPEVGATVTIEFDNADIHRPHITAMRYAPGHAPKGFKVGTFAIRGKHNQKIELKPDSNEMVFSAASLKEIATQRRQAVVGGDDILNVGGERQIIVQSTDVREARRFRDKAKEQAEHEYGSLSEIVDGAVLRKVGGSYKSTIGGSTTRTYLGSVSDSILGALRVLVGQDGYGLTSVGDLTLIGLPGSVSLNSVGGQVLIGADKKYIPLAVLVGSPAVLKTMIDGLTVNVGSAATTAVRIGDEAAASPVPHGEVLVQILTSLLTALQTPLQLGNLGAPTAPNPAFVAQVVPLIQQLSKLVSKRVFIAVEAA